MDSLPWRFCVMRFSHWFCDLIAKSCKAGDVHNEGTLIDVFIESIDTSICHSLSHYWTQNLQANLTNIAFQEKSFLSIQEGAGIVPNNNQGSYNADKRINRKPWNNNNLEMANVINSQTLTSTPRGSRRWPKLPPVLHVNMPEAPTTFTNSSLRSSFTILSINPSFAAFFTTHRPQLPSVCFWRKIPSRG